MLLLFYEILKLGIFEEADFKRQYYFQILAQKCPPRKAFFAPNLRIFIFAPAFAISQIRGILFQLLQ